MATGTPASKDGWLSVRLEGGIDVHLRLSDDLARAEARPGGPNYAGMIVTDVLISSQGDITTDTLRDVHIGRLIAALRPMDKGATMARARFREPDDDVTLGELRSRATPLAKAPPRKSLGRPDPSGDLDGFYRSVAKAYRSAAAESGRPAVVLAEENDVPVETVRRWVKEARRRGHLAPGGKGRAL